jgi:hypothetical protein
MNPLQPSALEVTAEVLGVVHLILMVTAVITVLRSKVYSAGPKAFLILLAVAIPIVGPVLTLGMCRFPGRVTNT